MTTAKYITSRHRAVVIFYLTAVNTLSFCTAEKLVSMSKVLMVSLVDKLLRAMIFSARPAIARRPAVGFPVSRSNYRRFASRQCRIIKILRLSRTLKLCSVARSSWRKALSQSAFQFVIINVRRHAKVGKMRFDGHSHRATPHHVSLMLFAQQQRLH